MSKTYIVNKNKERFEIDDWSNEYVKSLKCLYKGESKTTIYNDPDIVKKHIEFYENLEKFLNSREETIKKENVELKEKWTYEFDKDCDGIKVKDESDKWLFTIFSDQFGFSAPNKKKNHPYDVYAEINNYDTNSLKQISDYVYYSRTIGGSLLWPIDGGKRYNMARGGTTYYSVKKPNAYYIEDIVDLTLLEIKKYYDKSIDVSKDILSGCLTDNMKKWLDHFIDFKIYVKFFYFDNFVDEEYIPKSLLKNSDNNNLDLDGTKWKRIMQGRKEEIDRKDSKYKKELETLFENLKDMIKIRTSKIEEEINNWENNK